MNAYQDLVMRLLQYQQAEDRAALSALRSGLGKAPGEAPRMFPYLAGCFPDDGGENSRAMRVTFLLSANFARHPEHFRRRSLAAALRMAAGPDGKFGEGGVTSRFVAALDADPEDLPRHIEGLISLLATAGIGLDWFLLATELHDLLSPLEEDRIHVRLQWACDYFKGPQPTANKTISPENHP